MNFEFIHACRCWYGSAAWTLVLFKNRANFLNVLVTSSQWRNSLDAHMTLEWLLRRRFSMTNLLSSLLAFCTKALDCNRNTFVGFKVQFHDAHFVSRRKIIHCRNANHLWVNLKCGGTRMYAACVSRQSRHIIWMELKKQKMRHFWHAVKLNPTLCYDAIQHRQHIIMGMGVRR